MQTTQLILALTIIATTSLSVSAEESKQKYAYKLPASYKQASTKIYVEDEIREFLAGDGNFSSYNRLSGLINDIIREQKLTFMKKHPEKTNTASAKAEEALNVAALYASEENYRDSFKVLEGAFNNIKASIIKLRQVN